MRACVRARAPRGGSRRPPRLPVPLALQRSEVTTDEIDYAEMLDWFGWRFTPADDASKQWTLEVRPDATPEQRAHFAALLR